MPKYQDFDLDIQNLSSNIHDPDDNRFTDKMVPSYCLICMNTEICTRNRECIN